MPNNFFRFKKGYVPVKEGYSKVRKRELDKSITATSQAVAAAAGAFGPLPVDRGGGGGGGGGGVYNLLLSISGAPPTPPPTGDGSFVYGTAAPIHTDTNISGFVFDQWTGTPGDVALVSNPYANDTTVNMIQNVSLIAQYV